jgi:uncharacterized membrane protein YbhN (UPF0104 family)
VKRLLRDRRVTIPLQLAFLAIFLGFLGWAVRDTWAEAGPRLRDADPALIVAALAVLAVYYLLFVIGWQRILASYGIRVSYSVAVQSEMLSMLAKYIPGGVWTPAARVVALRRFGVQDTPVVIATILLEAGLSAVAGVLVFFASLPLVSAPDVPLWPLLLFVVVVCALLHPRVFTWLAGKVLRPFGGVVVVPMLPYRTALGLLVFYAGTWVVGGIPLFLLLRAVGEDVPLSAIPFLGGVSAVGAIVAVLVVFAPSGLGVLEASMYGLMLSVAGEAAALSVTILNRLAITIVEAILLVGAALAWRFGRKGHVEVRGAERGRDVAPAESG